MINANGKLYAKCGCCNKLVRLNKPILGSMHICLTEQERKQKEYSNYLMQRQLNYRHINLGSLSPKYEPQVINDNNKGK